MLRITDVVMAIAVFGVASVLAHAVANAGEGHEHHHGAEGGVIVPVHAISTDGVGAPIGDIVLEAKEGGFVLLPDLQGLEPGHHAFHIHENPSCDAGMRDGVKVAGLAGGGHFDPMGGGHHGHGDHGAHKSAHSAGHDHHSAHSDHHGHQAAGDLPQLMAAADGSVTAPVDTSKLMLDQVKGRSIMIHAFAEGTADNPRVACGVIPTE